MAEAAVQVKTVTKIRRPNPLYRKKTLRKMSPVTRELARLTGELASTQRRLKNLIDKVKAMEERDDARSKETQEVIERMKGD